MTYTEDFKCILAKQDNVVNANLFILRNSNPKKIKVCLIYTSPSPRD